MLVFDIKSLGFTEEDINVIEEHFFCNLSEEDWESMRLFENTEAIFKYLFIEDEDKDHLIDTLLEMGKISGNDLKGGQSLMEYMLENDEDRLMLPEGKWVMFTHELLHKEKLSQID